MPLTKERLSPWIVLPVCVSILLAGLDLGDRFWGSAADSRVTSYQVAQLTQAAQDLARKIDLMARQSSVDAISSRLDRDEGVINDFKTTAGTLDARLKILEKLPFRQGR